MAKKWSKPFVKGLSYQKHLNIKNLLSRHILFPQKMLKV